MCTILNPVGYISFSLKCMLVVIAVLRNDAITVYEIKLYIVVYVDFNVIILCHV